MDSGFDASHRPGMTTFKIPSHGQFPVPHRRTRRQAFSGIDNGVGADAVVAVEVVDGAGLDPFAKTKRFSHATLRASKRLEWAGRTEPSSFHRLVNSRVLIIPKVQVS